jgi:hypothetical protein
MILPFTYKQFKDYISSICNHDNESDICQEIENIIKDSYNENVWIAFKEYINSNVYNSTIDTLYNNIIKFPEKRINQIIGAGLNGFVIDMNDKVCKIFYNPIPQLEINFYNYCKSHKSNIFPYVYHQYKNLVILEKLNMYTDKCILYDSYITYLPKNTINGISMEDLILDSRKICNKQKYKNIIDNLNYEQMCVFNWGYMVLDYLKDAIDDDTSFYDIRLSNIGERINTGEIIFFDI